MATTAWQTQTKTKPLFPDLIWSRPERADLAGKLLIVGGSTHGFASVVKVMEAAKTAGIGEVKAVLPKGLEKHLGHSPELLYAPQTATGSFAKSSIAELGGYLSWAHGLLLPGDQTNNAETTIFAEELVRTTNLPTVITGEALDLLTPSLEQLQAKSLIVVANFRQLQQCVRANPLAEALLPRSTLEQRVQLLRKLIELTGVGIIVLHDQDQYLVVRTEQASLTRSTQAPLVFATTAAVLTAQFPSQLFEAVTTAAII